MQTLISTARQITGVGALSRAPKRMLAPIVRDAAGYERLLVLRNYESIAIILNINFYESLLKSVGHEMPAYEDISLTDLQRRAKEIMHTVSENGGAMRINTEAEAVAVVVNVEKFEQILDRLEQKQ